MYQTTTPLDTGATAPQPANHGCGCPDLAAFGHGADCGSFGGWRFRQTSDGVCSDRGCQHCRRELS